MKKKLSVVGVEVLQGGEADLLQIRMTLRPPSRVASALNSGQEQAHERAEDRDHNQQLDESESVGRGAIAVDGFLSGDHGGGIVPQAESVLAP